MTTPFDSRQRHTGGCACGAVRFECGPLAKPVALCHCGDCRRYVGAHVVGWCTVQSSAVSFTGQSLRTYRSSPRVLRAFCSTCGTSLSWAHDDFPGLMDITLASFDAASELAPHDHIWMRDALPWDRPTDGLPQHLAERDQW